MVDWVQQLQNDTREEFANAPIVATLATVDGETEAAVRPQARSIIVREITDDGALIFVSDGRSAKNRQLRDIPIASVVVYLSKLRRQYRFDGPVDVIDATTQTLRAEFWNRLSPKTRAMFLWPAPGDAFKPLANLVTEIDAVESLPASFEVLVVRPIAVDRLDLSVHPHLREQWNLIGSLWSRERVNP